MTIFHIPTLTPPKTLGVPGLAFETGDTPVVRSPSSDAPQTLSAPSIHRPFGEWVGYHNSQRFPSSSPHLSGAPGLDFQTGDTSALNQHVFAEPTQ